MGFILKNCNLLNPQSHENETILFAQPSGHERIILRYMECNKIMER